MARCFPSLLTRRPGFSGSALAWLTCSLGALQLWVSGQDVVPPGPAAGASKPAETKKEGVVESPWSASDTRLANQYIALLQQQPEYGNVLDLLWNLYQKRGQGELLLQYFESTAGPQGSPLGHLLYGHLLRKNEDLDGAKKHYEAVIKAVPQQKDALRGVAEILESQGQKARALSSYVRLVEIVPPGTEEGVALRLRLAALLRETGQIEQSVRIWEEVLEAHPGEVKLRTEVVGLLLEANRTPEAAKILESVVKDGTVEQRIDALRELARLHEFVNDFEASASADRRGMALAHFRNYVHEEFFTRLVRLYERFGRLVELETELKKPAEMEHPGEREVYLLAEYYRLTARQPDRIAWTRRLVELVPASVDYRLQLASLLLDSDQNEEADRLLAKLIAEQPDAPLPLILLRVQATIRQSGKAAAGALLTKYLDEQVLPDDSMRRVLDFSREYYLDDIVERILREHGLVAAAQAGESTPFEVELAKFHRERGRTKEAIETLQRWVAQTGVGLQDRVARLHLAARTLRDQGLSEQAGQMLEQIITLNPADEEAQMSLAELLAEQRDVSGAIAAYESLWRKAGTIAGQVEIDQRLFGLLRGIAPPKKEETGNVGTAPREGVLGIPMLNPLEEPAFRTELRKQATALSQNQGAFSEPPSVQLVEFYGRIKKTAREEPTVPNRFRAAWWAFKLVDLDEARTHLAALHDPAKPTLEVERLLLDLAEQTENRLLVGRQLELLAKIDPERGAEYQHRWAEFRFELGYEDEAVRLLQKLASSSDATLNTLKSLANVYQKQGRTNDQVRVWKDAFDRANLFEKREIVKQFSNTLVENGRPEDALKAYIDLIAKENDLTQKRKQLDAQITLANRHYLTTWLKDRYQELAQQHPFERFFPEALARVHEVLGNHTEAYQAMKRAYYMAGHDRELLDELSEMATRSQDLKAAIYYRRQIISQNEEGATPENWQTLAGMLEEDLRVGEADAVRERLESKFSQNADFLKDLVRHYRESGQTGRARRVLERLKKLRPWDTALVFELGLLRRDAGEAAAALECFESVIAQTAEAAFPTDGDSAEPLPVIRGGWNRGASARPDWGGLETFAGTLQETPFMSPETQDLLVEWFRKSRPEYDTQPRADGMLRLRAIEEAARLSAGLSPEVLAGWVERWTAEKPPVSPTERLWALVHAGAGEAASPLLRGELMRARSAERRLLLSVIAGRLQLWSLLGEWVAMPQDAPELPGRPLYPALAILLLGVENETPFSRAGLAALIPRLVVSESFALHLLKRFEQAGAYENAFVVGEILAAQGHAGEDTEILYTVSHSARNARHPQRADYWLEKAAQSLGPRPGRDVSAYHAAIVSEWSAKLVQGQDRVAFLRNLEHRFSDAPGVAPYPRLFVQAQTALLRGDRDAFLGVMGDYRRTVLGLALPQQPPDPGDLEFPEVATAWKNLRSILNLFAPRSHHLVSPAELAETLSPGFELPAEGPRTRSEADDFMGTRLVWTFEGLTPRERSWMLDTEAMPLTTESRMDLARSLESGGFAREAAHLYGEALVTLDDADYPLVNAFLQASRKGKDFEPVVALLEEYQAGQRRLPSGYNQQKLSEDLSEFLGLAGKREALEKYAAESRPGYPSISDNHLRRLAGVLAQEGATDALVATTTRLVDGGMATREDRLNVARHLINKGRTTEALPWLEGIPFDLDQRETEIEALRVLTSVLARQTPVDQSKLERYARVALRYDNASLTGDVATSLNEAGLTEEATGALWLAARREKSEDARFQLLARLLALRALPGSDPAAWSAIAGAILESAPAENAAHLAILQALAATCGAPTPAGANVAWRDLLEANADRQSAKATVLLGRALLDGVPPGLWGEKLRQAKLPNFPAGASLLADFLASPGVGKPAVLRQWLDEVGDLVWDMAGRDASRQVAWFGQAGDKLRASELQSRLLEEASSDRFLTRNPGGSLPSFDNRWMLPEAFSRAGFDDLAGALYRTYAARLARWSDERDFLTQYARFLMRTGDFTGARSVLVRGFQKEIGLDPLLLVEYYRSIGHLDDVESGLQQMQVAPGNVAAVLSLLKRGSHE